MRPALAAAALLVLAAACAPAPAVPSAAPPAAATQAARATRAPVPASYVIAGFIGMPNAPRAFDHAVVDDASRTLFLADRSNAGVDVFDLSTELYRVTVSGFSGRGGPNGLALVPDRGELWAADGDSSVKVIDAAKRAVVASVSTGGRGRSDDLAYDPRDKIVVVGNDSDPTPFLTFISVTTRAVVGRLELPGAGGLEEVQWDADRGAFYQAVPSTPANPGGEVDVIDPVAMRVKGVLPLADCEPHGLAIGARGEILLGCGRARALIIDPVTGATVATITQIGGADVVWFNPGANHYFVAGTSTGTGGTQVSGAAVGVIDAGTDRWLQNVATVGGAHTVVADPTSNRVYVPKPGQGITVLGAGSGVTNQDR